MAGLDPAIPLRMARPCLTIGIAGSSPAMTAEKKHLIRTCSIGRASVAGGYWDRDRSRDNSRVARSNCSRSVHRTSMGQSRDRVPAAGRCRNRSRRTSPRPHWPRELPPKVWWQRQRRLPTSSTSSSSSPHGAFARSALPRQKLAGQSRIPVAMSLSPMWGIDGGAAHTDLRRFARSCAVSRSFRGGAKAPNPESSRSPDLRKRQPGFRVRRWRAPRND
jgi:hypothetical protein